MVGGWLAAAATRRRRRTAAAARLVRATIVAMVRRPDHRIGPPAESDGGQHDSHDASTPQALPWPRRGRREMLANMEKYLEVQNQIIRIVSYRVAEKGRLTAGRFPPAIAAVLPLCERASTMPRDGDLGVGLEGTAEEFWARLCQQAEALADEAGISEWKEPSRLSPWGLLKLIAVAVASGATYAASDLSDPDDEMPRWAMRVEAAHLILVSGVQLLLKDTRRLGWLVRQTLSRRRLRLLCRHYTVAVHALFYAAKRARALHPQVHVLSVFGRADFSHPLGHAWNWYVDSRTRDIVALDLTGADWLLDRGQAESILNRGFDGARWNNVSCFLSTLFFGFGHAGSPLHGRSEVAAAVAALVDPGTPRGQALLFRLAQQRTLSDTARSRIAARLRADGFGRAFLGWQAELDPAGLFWRAAARIDRGRDPSRELALLDAIGV